MVLTLLVSSLITASPLILAAIGFTLIYRLFGLINIAHAEFLTLGGYFSYVLLVILGLNIIVSLVLGALIVGIASIFIYLMVFKPFFEKKYSLVTLIIVSCGISFFIRHLSQLIFGSREKFFPVEQAVISISGISITPIQLICILTTIIVMVGIHYLLSYTSLGRKMRALADIPELASASGINPVRISIIVFFLAGILGGISGGFLGAFTYVTASLGWSVLLVIIAIAILGGIGNPYGAMLGGFIIAMIQSLVITFGGAEYALLSSYLILIIVLLMRPQGILGGKL